MRREKRYLGPSPGKSGFIIATASHVVGLRSIDTTRQKQLEIAR